MPLGPRKVSPGSRKIRAFRTRTSGSPKQIGQKFPVIEKKTLPPRIRITGAARANVPTFVWEETDIPWDERHKTSATETPEANVPKEIVGAAEEYAQNIDSKEKPTYLRGIYKGAPVYAVFFGGDFAGTWVRKMVVKDPAEQKLAKKKWLHQAEPHKTKEEISKIIKKAAAKEKKEPKGKPRLWQLDAKTVLDIEAKKEKKEHPWASKKTAEKIAEDHIAKDIAKDKEFRAAYAQYLKDVGVPKSLVATSLKAELAYAKRKTKPALRGLKQQIAEKVRSVKYPVSERGPSYRKYLQKLTRRRKWTKRATLYSVPLAEAAFRKKIKKAQKKK